SCSSDLLSCIPISLCLLVVVPPVALHSFPTRRSSDLGRRKNYVRNCSSSSPILLDIERLPQRYLKCWRNSPLPLSRFPSMKGIRSEEHTSELQSRFDLVCRLLLEKKHQHTIVVVDEKI